MPNTTAHCPEGGVAVASLEGTAEAETEPSSSEPPPTRRGRSRLRRDLRCSVKDSAAFSVMVGVGETYIPAFVLALGLGEIAAGMAASVPMLMGAILQVISPWAAARIGSNRRWVIGCVILQALSFVPLIVTALIGHASVFFIFAVVAIYWAAGQGSSPAWNAWMETVVPSRVRPNFFAFRTRLGQAGVLAGFVLGGFTLQYGKMLGNPLPWFAAIFAVAAICRLISAQYLVRQHESQTELRKPRNVSAGQLWGRIRAGKSERVLLYFLAVQISVQVSGPYFTPYMLKQLHLSYAEFVLLLASSFLGKILVLPMMGRIAYRFGTRTLLWVGGIGIIPVSGLWLYTDTFAAMVALQFLAGAVWAAYELAMALLFFETVRSDERTSILTKFNLANAAGLCIGALIGGTVLKTLGQCPEAYLFIFGLSSLFRACSLLVLRFTPNVEALETDPEPVAVPAPAAPIIVRAPIPEPKLRQASGVLPVPATVSAPSK